MILILSFVLSLVACCFFFTDLFWLRDQSFVWHHDSEVPFQNIFMLVSSFFQGQIQLFDPYDGFNIAYTQLSTGLYNTTHLITAFVYTLFFPFYDQPGEAYHHTFSVFSHAVTMFIRTIGGYLLLRKFKISTGMTILSLIILNTFLSSTLYFGLLTENIYSYFPLLAYFILNFFERLRLKDLLRVVLVFVVCVANSPLFALGYFYEPVHYFIIAAAIASLFRWNLRVKEFSPKGGLKLFAAAVLVSGLILAPTVIFMKSLSKDFYVAGSGLGGTEGRLKNMFNPTKYFSPRSETMIPPVELPIKIIDFKNNWWEKSWIFWGAGITSLAILGLIAARGYARYAFASVIALVILSNLPLKIGWPWSLAHWINVLTNPFSFLLRSYHMPILLLPFVLFPLVAFGLQVWRNWAKGEELHWFRKILLVTVFALIVAWALQVQPPLRSYVVTASALMLAAVIGMCIPPSMWPAKLRIGFALTLLVSLLAIDSWALSQYYINNQDFGRYFTRDDGRHLKPRVFKNFEDQRLLVIEYQNPSVMPWREFVRIYPSDTDPTIHSDQNHYGYFYKYPALERYLHPVDIYAPRPVLYKDFGTDIEFVKKIAQDSRSLILAIGSIDGPHQALGRHVEEYKFDLSKARRSMLPGYVRYQWPLPKQFPKYVTTGIFTEDKDTLRTVIGNDVLLPVQGAVVEPLQFDVGNIKKGQLTISMPKDVDPADKTARLFYNRSNEIKDVWLFKADEIGFTFLSSEAGWLKTRLPYDPKWVVTIDGKKVSCQVVDSFFLGCPMSAGEHQVVMKYWPNTPLRPLIPISIILSFCVLTIIVVRELKDG
jgi:hypothetical protein